MTDQTGPLHTAAEQAATAVEPFLADSLPAGALDRWRKLLTTLPLTRGNHVELLIDGDATFDAIFDAIDSAQDYLLVQFFIIHDDSIGIKFQQRLIQRAGAGVRIYFPLR